VRIAADGEQALALMEGEPPDLVIMDVMIPYRSGYEVLAAFRKNPVWSQVPVIMLHRPRPRGGRVAGALRRRKRLPHQALPAGRAARTRAQTAACTMKTVPRPLVIIAFAAALVSAEGYAEERGLSSLPDEGLSSGSPAISCRRQTPRGLRWPSATRSGRTQLALRSARENLSNGSPDWTDSGLEVVHEFEREKSSSVRSWKSSRYGLTDRTLTVEGYYPFSERATGYLLVAASDTHLVLARDTVHAQLAYALRDGWG